MYHNQTDNIDELDIDNAKSDNETLKLQTTHQKDQDEDDFEGSTPTTKGRREATMKLLDSNVISNKSNELN